MGFKDHLEALWNKKRKTFLNFAMLTSIVTAAALTSTTCEATDASAAADGNQQKPHRYEIPFCGDDEGFDRSIGRRLLYVTTLDGRLTALDMSKSGKLRWSIPTGPGPLISSSIHRLELTNNGQFVRMIPSLSGGIYKFDGESIDPIPITTENLLSSSAKFSDDLVISGGKETRTYGISVRTGQMIYKCSMHNCVNSTNGINNDTTTPGNMKLEDVDNVNGKWDHDPLKDDLIIVRRQTQTVRAVESRTGIERWNFSVGQHELDLKKPSDCHDPDFNDMDMAILDLDIRVIVPEGIICAFSKSEANEMLWKYKFDHPIVSAWKTGSDDELENIDLFGSAQWLWNNEENIYELPFSSTTPSIYLGMYDKQLYIQESINIRREISDNANVHLHSHLTTDSIMPKIPWRPIPAGSNSLMILHQNDKLIVANNDKNTLPPDDNYNSQNAVGSFEVHGNELIPYNEENNALTAQSVLNASEFVNGNGFYFFSLDDLEKDAHALCDTDENDDNNVPNVKDDNKAGGNISNSTIDDDLGFSLDDVDAPVKVVILSLWFWWKEIAVIAITTAVLVNLFIGQRQRTDRGIIVIERHIRVPTAIEATESSTAALLGPITNTNSSKSNSNGHRTLSESTTLSGENFTSRFQSDFDLMRCLGRGGFGVVFEAKNKLDDCKYAVKRITLPNKKESRERVMREVKTLAHCEHHNIVRYFQAWVESPPPGWQDEEDSKWLSHEMSTSIQIETPDGTTLPSFEPPSNKPQKFSPQQHNHNHNHHPLGLSFDKKQQLISWVSSVTNTACSSDNEYEDDSLKKVVEEDEDDDSCIVFRTESESMAMRDNDSDDDDDDDEDSASDNKENHLDDSNKTEKPQSVIKRPSQSDAISIDIHSDTFDLSLLDRNRRNITYSQLSDSFEIEFVRSANTTKDKADYEEIENKDSYHRQLNDKLPNGYNHKNLTKSTKTRPMSLNLNELSPKSNGSNNNDKCKALLPVMGTSPPNPQKPIQNKVYLYIQMQLCRKESLRDWLRENKTEVRQQHVASIFHQIVDAVDYVHLKGLIHRDLKPSNIFFSQDGQIKIGDFGLVTDMSDIPNMVTKCSDHSGLPQCSRHTQQVGTHLYMSPEQLKGQHYDYKVDIYSLGLIFFELLVFFATEMERIVTLRNLRDGRYPEKFPTEFPQEYQLLQSMLSKCPDARPATKELKLQLLDILKLPEDIGDADTEFKLAAVAAVARRLSHSRTFSSSE